MASISKKLSVNMVSGVDVGLIIRIAIHLDYFHLSGKLIPGEMFRLYCLGKWETISLTSCLLETQDPNLSKDL